MDLPAENTRRIVELHNAAWAQGDVAAVLALYHPEMRFVDHFAGRSYEGEALRKHVHKLIERSALETLRYADRIRVDGDTAFLRYRETVRAQGGDELISFSACDSVRVADGWIVEINEYAVPLATAPSARSSAQRKIGLSPRALGFLLNDLRHYFARERAHLNTGLGLQQVADATGYTRNQISYALNQSLGLSFYRYLGDLRVRHLLDTPGDFAGLGAAELAGALGFRSVSAFYASFRRIAGMTPAQWLTRNTGSR